jgi:hypothetical protein
MSQTRTEWLAYVTTLATLLLAVSYFGGTGAPWWSPLVPIPICFVLVFVSVFGAHLARAAKERGAMAVAEELKSLALYIWRHRPIERRVLQLVFAYGLARIIFSLSGCTALTDFDRFHYAEGLELDADAGELERDAGEDLEQLDDAGELERDAGEDLEQDAGPKPYSSRLLGTWKVGRSLRSFSPCTYAPSPSTVWVVAGSAAALTVTVDNSDRFTGRENADGSFSLAGSMQTITGKVSASSFEGIETNTQPVYGQPCTVTRGLTGTR